MKASGASNSRTKLAAPIGVTIASVRVEYARADVFCGEVQSFCGKAGIPAINELRNAGKHLLAAVGDDGSIQDHENLLSAMGHSRRAAYEAFEAGILTALEIIRKFKTDYQTIVVTQIVPDYVIILQKASAAQRAVEEGRKTGFDRTADHTGRMAAFRELRDLCERLDLSRDEANKLVLGQKAGDRQASRNTLFGYIGIAIGATGLVFGGPAFIDWLNKPATPAIEAKAAALPATAQETASTSTQATVPRASDSSPHAPAPADPASKSRPGASSN